MSVLAELRSWREPAIATAKPLTNFPDGVVDQIATSLRTQPNNSISRARGFNLVPALHSGAPTNRRQPGETDIMLSSSKILRTLAPLLACLLISGCMDESFEQLEVDGLQDAEIHELLEDEDLDDQEIDALIELLEASELSLQVPNPIPCDPDPLPLEVDAPERAGDAGEYPPAPLGIDAATLDPEPPAPVDLGNPDQIFADADRRHW
ncbi:hypothetical protein [Enhygromyxa salina]|uniref:hypothetical protein n=1 Tax=Enhygromyxa salina TaxID=215803 RepID=UPI0011B219FA|nr:hypothetical protein [Enhygromyxa salina]